MHKKTKKKSSMRGGSIKYKNKEFVTHTALPMSLSAVKTFSLPQIFIISSILVSIIVGCFTAPFLTLQVLVSLISIIYFTDTVFHLVLMVRSMRKTNEIYSTKKELQKISDKDLPIYTILCPLYKETYIIPQFVEAISDLDYPKNKLDVMLLLEEDDHESIKIANQMNLPFYFRIVVVPDSLPKTKPKACNYGLSYAKGEYLVIFDAEDIPDPLQLKKAYLGFQKASSKVACLQAKLNYYNPKQNILTRFFTAEYSLWFDLTLIGLQSFNSTIPLGGTSNHFKTKVLRELLGWDPFNVTEDADLGIRLFNKGFKTAMIDSTTYEEATSKVKNWIRQRSRWIKGYMQTYLVHTRRSREFLKQNGAIHTFIFHLTVGGKLLFLLVNPLMWIITLGYFFAYSFFGPTLEAIYQPPISYLAVFSWIFGNFLFIYYYMLGCARRNQWDLMKYIFLIPIYWGMMSFAGVLALYQLLFKPHYWEKTLHGFHLAPVVKQEMKAAKAPAIRPAYSYAAIVSNAIKVRKIPLFSIDDIVGNLYQILLGFNFLNRKTTPAGTIFRLKDEKKKVEAVKNSTFFDHVAEIVDNNLSSFFDILRKSTKEKTVPKKGLRILIFNWRDTRHIYAGGAEVYVHELAKRWVKDGSKVTVFCGNDNRSPFSEFIDGVEIIRRGGTYTIYIFAIMYYFLKFRGKYDVIIDCENGIPFFTPLFTRVPVVLLIHHVHQEIFKKFLKFPLREIAEFLEGTLMPFVYRSKVLVTVSESSKREIMKLGFTNEDNIEVVYNGVAKTPPMLISKTPNPSFLYLGRLKEYKNIDIAIDAFSTFVKDYPKAILSIVGSGEYSSILEKQVAELNLSDKIHFYGKVSEEEKAFLLSASWVMLQPSSAEGWGLTVIEANATGTPVIASRVNGLKDSVVDGKTGMLVQVRNTNQFATAMRLVIEDTSFRNILSQNAYTWSKNFDWDKSALHFYQLIGKTSEVDSYERLSGELSLALSDK